MLATLYIYIVNYLQATVPDQHLTLLFFCQYYIHALSETSKKGWHLIQTADSVSVTLTV